MSAGKTPTPMKKAEGTTTEATTLLKLGWAILDMAEKPAGKKEPARAGCMNRASHSHPPLEMPSKIVATPPAARRIEIASFGPTVSANHPATRVARRPEIWARPSNTRLSNY
jgi:hypothetical protein